MRTRRTCQATRRTRQTLAALLSSAALLAASAPVARADGVLWAPATVGSPAPGYTQAAQVAVSQVSCTGGTAGAWIAIPTWLTAAIDVAAGVWQQPSSWVIGDGAGIQAPASGTTVCYQVDAVTLGGTTFGTMGNGDVTISLYPSGSFGSSTTTTPSLATAAPTQPNPQYPWETPDNIVINVSPPGPQTPPDQPCSGIWTHQWTSRTSGAWVCQAPPPAQSVAQAVYESVYGGPRPGPGMPGYYNGPWICASEARALYGEGNSDMSHTYAWC